MTVTLAWSGTATAGHVVSPTTVEFAVGSDNALVTPTFAPGPVSGGDLTLTLVSGPGYQLGTPSAATTQFRDRPTSLHP